jgi:hypothetical protein
MGRRGTFAVSAAKCLEISSISRGEKAMVRSPCLESPFDSIPARDGSVKLNRRTVAMEVAPRAGGLEE